MSHARKSKSQQIYDLVRNWCLSHKLWSIIIAGVLVLALLLAIILPIALGGNSEFIRRVNRGQWTERFAETFGYNNFDSKTPYFKDVNEKNDLFAAVQTLAENEIIPTDKRFKANTVYTGNQMLVEVGRAFGEDYVAKRIKSKTVSDEQFITYLVEIAPELGDYAIDSALNSTQVDAMLKIAHKAFATRSFDNSFSYKLKKGVIDLGDYNYTINGSEYTVDFKGQMKLGDIVLLPISSADKNGAAIKIENISGRSGNYSFTGSQVKLEEVFESIDMEVSQLLSSTPFYPSSGVYILKYQDNEKIKWNGKEVTNNHISVKSSWFGGKSLVQSDKYNKILGNVDFFTAFANDTNINKNYVLSEENELVKRYEEGYSLHTEFDIGKVAVTGTISYHPDKKNDKALEFNLNTYVDFTVFATMTGEEARELYLGSYFVTLNDLCTLKVDLYMSVSVDGEVKITSSYDTVSSVTKASSSLASNASMYFSEHDVKALDCPSMVQEKVTTVLTIAGIPMVDNYFKLAYQSEMAHNPADPDKVTITSYSPLVSVGVGFETNSTLGNWNGVNGFDVFNRSNCAFLDQTTYLIYSGDNSIIAPYEPPITTTTTAKK